MSTEDLWGEIPDVEPIKTPLSIFKEQAAILKEKTNGALEAEVTVGKESPQEVGALMKIVVPTLGGYTVNIAQINYGLEIYPVTVFNLRERFKEIAEDEISYKKILATVFSSSAVKEIIRILLQQVKSA